MILSTNSEYQFNVSFKNFLGLEGVERFTIKTAEKKGINLLILDSIGTQAIKAFQPLELGLRAWYSECDLGNQIMVPRSIKLEVITIDDETQQVRRTEEFQLAESENFFSYKTGKYTLEAAKNYLLKVTASLADNSLEN